MKKLQIYTRVLGLFILTTLVACGGKENNEKGIGTLDETVIEAGVRPHLAMLDSTHLDSLTKVKIETSVGSLIVALYNETPLHKANFIKLAKNNFYNNTLFHRVIKGFMVQGGDPESKNAASGIALGSGGPGYLIDKEFRKDLFHIKGALAAARQGGPMNPEMKSSGSQFYIVTGKRIDAGYWASQATRGAYAQAAFAEFFANPSNQEYNLRMQSCRQRQDMAGLEALNDEIEKLVAPKIDLMIAQTSNELKSAYATIGGTPSLDNQYTVFGYLVLGYETLQAIENTATAPGDRPVQDLKILKCSIILD